MQYGVLPGVRAGDTVAQQIEHKIECSKQGPLLLHKYHFPTV